MSRIDQARFTLTAAVVLIALAAVARFIPHPHNFTPVLAIGIFGGALLGGRAAYLLPLAAMLLSDLALNHDFSPMTAVIYACLAAGALLGRLLQRRRTWPRTIAATLAGSTLFYLVTNFVVWARGTLYEHTFAGLAQCYAMALPFFRNGLLGDLFWTTALFLVYDAAVSMRLKVGSDHSAGAE